jgi:hypothetical protein
MNASSIGKCAQYAGVGLFDVNPTNDDFQIIYVQSLPNGAHCVHGCLKTSIAISVVTVRNNYMEEPPVGGSMLPLKKVVQLQH